MRDTNIRSPSPSNTESHTRFVACVLLVGAVAECLMLPGLLFRMPRGVAWWAGCAQSSNLRRVSEYTMRVLFRSGYGRFAYVADTCALPPNLTAVARRLVAPRLASIESSCRDPSLFLLSRS